MANYISTLPEVNVEPLGDIMLNFLIEKDHEDEYLDFKESLSISKDSPFAKVAKDIFAFSNWGGGFIIIGFRDRKNLLSENPEEKRNYLPILLPENFHIDQADLQSKFNAYSPEPLHIQYQEFFRNLEGADYKLAAIYVPPSTSVLKPLKDGFYVDEKGKRRQAFSAGAVLIRRGTQSVLASKEETSFVQRRAQTEGYRISVLSGQPDQIQEKIYSNLFEVTKIPKIIWTAYPKSADSVISGRVNNIPYSEVYTPWNNKIVTFTDLSNPKGPFWNEIETSSIQKEDITGWLNDTDKQRIVINLLNKEIRFLADRIGLLREEYRRQKFYYSCDGESRTETWSPRYRTSSTLTVAQRMWANQLGRYIFWHISVMARFRYIGNRLFLRLDPTLLITTDGRRAVFGEKEGTIITRLTYHRYNASYLNSLLFWISRFAEGKDSFSLAQGKIVVSAKPVESKINIGILSDRPVAEPPTEIPVEIEEDSP
jgi:hypothetical protein